MPIPKEFLLNDGVTYAPAFVPINLDGSIITGGGGVGGGTVTMVRGNGTVNGLTLTGNVTTSGNLTLGGNLTLNTINGNVGTFGNATTIPVITVNAEGLTTGVFQTLIPEVNAGVTGLLTPADFNEFKAKGTSNLTVGTAAGTAFDGALGAGATSNITALQGNVSNLTTDVNALNSAMRYIGGWDASAGVFPAGSQAGYVYSVTVDGTVGGVDFVATDRLLSILDNASTTTYVGNWLKEDYTDKIVSVNGQVGAVSLTTANISASADKNYVTDAMLSKINQTAANANVSFVQGNGTVNGLTLTGNVTSGGNLTLGGNLTGTASGLTAGNVTNIPALSGAITGNATGVTTLTANGTTSAQLAASLTDETGTGLNVFNTNCALVTPSLGTPSALNLTNAVSLSLTSGVSGVLPVANGGVDQTAWASWTPTFTNLTLGNGTVVSKYKTIGKTIFFQVLVTLGTTSSMGTDPFMTLPVTGATAPSAQFEIAVGRIRDVGTTQYDMTVWMSSTTTITMKAVASGGAYTAITATAPHTWAATDQILFQGFYESA
jgi:hypothetical protein